MKTLILIATLAMTTNATAATFSYSADPVLQKEIVQFLTKKNTAAKAGALCFTEKGSKNIWLGFDPKHCNYLAEHLGWHMTDTK